MCNGAAKLTLFFFFEGRIIVLGLFYTDVALPSSLLCQYLITVIDMLTCPFLTNWLVLHNRTGRFVLNCSFGSHHCEMLSSLNWLPLSQGRELNGFAMAHCTVIGVLRRCSGSESRKAVMSGSLASRM